MRVFDFSSWQSIATTLFGLALVTLIGVGIRLMVMMTIQQRRERLNRQINERLRTLIAAYKTLGGSFTGNLMVDPRHLRDIRRGANQDAATEPSTDDDDERQGGESDRPRRIRDAVEAALSDIILLGTADQVRLAATAARELSDGRPVHVHDLVVALRDYVRDALDLDAVRPTSQSRCKARRARRAAAARAVGPDAAAGMAAVAVAAAVRVAEVVWAWPVVSALPAAWASRAALPTKTTIPLSDSPNLNALA